MKVGMMWFDGDRKADLSSRVERAANYYREKYGHKPNLCLVHPQTPGEQTPSSQPAGVEVKTSASVLPDHFWLGVEEKR